jgi:hypothetical protein
MLAGETYHSCWPVKRITHKERKEGVVTVTDKEGNIVSN